MKRAMLSMAILVAGTVSATSAEIAPEDVVFKDGAVETPLTDKPGDPAAGRMVIGTKKLGNCVACHAVSEMSDIPFHGEIGPLLDGAGDRYTEAELRAIIVDAKKVFPDSVMPSFYKTGPYIRPGKAFTGKAPDGPLPPLLTAQQVEDVVAYLKTLKD